MSSGATFPCDLCDPTLKCLACWKCLVCDEYLCVGCSFRHQRSKSLRSHELKELGILDPTMEGKIKLVCHKHPEKQIIFFCQQCNVLMCISCKDTNHYDHAFNNGAEAAAELKRKLETMLHQCEDSLEELGLAEKTEKERCKAIDDEERQDIDAIEKRYVVLHKALEDEVLRKKTAIQAACNKRRERTRPAAAFFSVKENLQELISQGTNIEILSSGQELIRRTKSTDTPESEECERIFFNPAEVKPKGIMAFLLGNVEKETPTLDFNPYKDPDPDPYKCGKCGETKEAALVCMESKCKSKHVVLLRDWDH